MFKKLKHLTKESLIFLVIFSLVCWSVSIPLTHFIKDTKSAGGGVDTLYTDDGGSTPDVYLNATSTPESILRITAYETQSGTNTIDSITLQLSSAMDCPPGGGACTESPFTLDGSSPSLASLSTASTSGLSLWYDSNGNGSFDFNETLDSLISSTSDTVASPWITQTITDPMGYDSWTVWETTFSNLSNYINIPITHNTLNIFVVAKAGDNIIDAPSSHKFYIDMPQYAVQVTAAAGAIVSNWPTDTYGTYFPPVSIGAEGSGGNMMY